MQRQLRNVESAPDEAATALFAKESDLLPTPDAISDN
jgi:hypothetical protein